jgi:hypothetical protein
MEIISVLNNREISVVIWLLIVFLWALSVSSVRQSIFGLFKAFFVKIIIVPFAVMLLYVLLTVLIFKKVGFWDISALKDTILWTIGTAFATFLSLNKVAGDENFFRKALLDNIKLVLILEFIVNLYSFNLIIELILVPIVTFIVMLNAVAELKPEYKQARVFLDYTLGIVGLVLIVFTFRELFVDFQNFATLKTLRDFFLPPIFTIAFLPYVYLIALYMQYESLFTRIDFANKDADLARYAKRKILAACHLDLSKLNKFSTNVGLPKVNGKGDVSALIKKALKPAGA